MAVKALNDDLDIVQKLVIPGLDADLDVVQKLDDEPNDVGGLTAAQLKAKFDESGNTIKRYINETLLPAVSDTVAEAEEREIAEADRVTAEEDRAAAELAREEAEQLRAEAEAARAAAEPDRAAAELAREEAEAARAAAEEARDAAEKDRVDETAGVVALAREQAEAAQAARGGAETAADRAERAAAQAADVTGGPFAPLDEAGKVPVAHLPDEALTPQVTIYQAGTQPPDDQAMLWIDTTAATGGLKYHNGTAWVHVPVAYT